MGMLKNKGVLLYVGIPDGPIHCFVDSCKRCNVFFRVACAIILTNWRRFIAIKMTCTEVLHVFSCSLSSYISFVTSLVMCSALLLIYFLLTISPFAAVLVWISIEAHYNLKVKVNFNFLTKHFIGFH